MWGVEVCAEPDKSYRVIWTWVLGAPASTLPVIYDARLVVFDAKIDTHSHSHYPLTAELLKVLLREMVICLIPIRLKNHTRFVIATILHLILVWVIFFCCQAMVYRVVERVDLLATYTSHVR